MFCSFIVWVLIFALVVGLIVGALVGPLAACLATGGIIILVFLFFIIYAIKIHNWRKEKEIQEKKEKTELKERLQKEFPLSEERGKPDERIELVCEANPSSRNVNSKRMIDKSNIKLFREVERYRINLKVSPNNKRLAYSVSIRVRGYKNKFKNFVVVDGIKSKKFDGHSLINPIFSPDSSNVAYVATINRGSFNEDFVILNGNEISSHFGEHVHELTFSPNSNHLAYYVTSSEASGPFLKFRNYIVVNGVKGEKHDHIVTNSLTFSPDSKGLIYIAEEASKYCIVKDGKKGKIYNLIGGVINTTKYEDSDSGFYDLFIDEDNETIKVWKDSKMKMEDIRNPVKGGKPRFSSDCKKLAYAAEKGDKWTIVVNETESKEYDGIGIKTPIFSPDSKKLAFVAINNGKHLVIVNDEIIGEYEAIANDGITFSPDSTRLGYIAKKREGWCVILDGRELKVHEKILKNSFNFSPNGQDISYIAKKGNKYFVVYNQNEGNLYDKIEEFKFSPDSKSIAYKASLDNKEFIVLGDKEFNRYDNIKNNTLTFSPDGKNIVYAVSVNNKDAIVVNNEIINTYDEVITEGGGRIVFDSSSKFHYLILDRGYLYLVEDVI